MEEVKWKLNDSKYYKSPKSKTEAFSNNEVKKIRYFHSTIPGYFPTPLRGLNNFAKRINVKKIYIKDESYRFGLNAFKVLGGSFAIAQYLAQKLEKDISEMPFAIMISNDVRKKLGEVVFATTTDGNHGRGIAWTARMLKQKAVVYMPKGSAQIRLENIQAEGAQAKIINANYDDAVRITAKDAKINNWVVIQDTAWEGYTNIPLWIMQGYVTMASEADMQLELLTNQSPTHIFVQAGVGSLAGAVQGYFVQKYGKNRPKVIVVESSAADCLYKSAVANNGKAHNVGGELNTIMAGLACGEPNIISWEILRDYAECFVSCPDHVAEHGMKLLGNPIDKDKKVISGESGAVTAGLLASIMCCKEMETLKCALELNERSQVLLFSTEGDTDPEKYRQIVWGKDCLCGK